MRDMFYTIYLSQSDYGLDLFATLNAGMIADIGQMDTEVCLSLRKCAIIFLGAVVNVGGNALTEMYVKQNTSLTCSRERDEEYAEQIKVCSVHLEQLTEMKIFSNVRAAKMMTKDT
ncbi:hypothetical protein BaRGS_00013306 [Batillaria attramentaria]|uniref:Uncharacterized protein n=1 Tax=Batillaria attramentaria TaxID=370345 RepID=A0ABD0L7L6_9CAEN